MITDHKEDKVKLPEKWPYIVCLCFLTDESNLFSLQKASVNYLSSIWMLCLVEHTCLCVSLLNMIGITISGLNTAAQHTNVVTCLIFRHVTRVHICVCIGMRASKECLRLFNCARECMYLYVYMYGSSGCAHVWVHARMSMYACCTLCAWMSICIVHAFV